MTTQAINLCPVHRRPRGRDGCPQCARALEKERREEHARIVRLAAWSLGALVGVAAIWLLATRGKPTDGRLDPTPFRAEMERFESSLYRTGRLGEGARNDLLEAGRAFETVLRKSLPFLPAKAADELIFCVATTSKGGDRVGDNVDFPALRQRWEETRTRHFQDADWFARGSVALETAQQTGEARGIVSETAAYEQTLTELSALVQRVQFDFERMLAGDGTGIDPQREDWLAAKQAAEADLEKIKAGMPAPPRGANQAWIDAWHRLEAAVKSVPSLFRDERGKGGLPNQGMASWRIAGVKAKVAEAEQAFKNAPR